MLNKHEVIKITQKLLQEDSNVKFAYLFGSYADESYNDRSDVDIALYLDEYNFDKQLSISFELSKALNKDVDLVILNSAKNLYLLDDILRKGVLLKDNEYRVDFELKKHHQFIDFIEFKKRIYAA